MDFKLKGGMPGMPQLPPAAPLILIVPGAGMILFGVLIFANEWLLRWIVAGMFCLLGALLLFAGMRAKRMMGG